ncbi:MAG: thiamine phosphate synthase [Arcobacteraceae bacterium]
MNNYIKETLQEPNLKTPLYALCDFETLSKKNLTIAKFIALTKRHNVKLLQYRDKQNSLTVQKEHLNILRKALNIPIIINDTLELLENADGLHLGQEDIVRIMEEKIPLKEVKLLFKYLQKKYPNKIFGISTHNEIEILNANELKIHYIGLGAYKATSTKDVSTILGDKISYLAKISKHPVCAIGGVKIDDKLENIAFNVVGSDLYRD